MKIRKLFLMLLMIPIFLSGCAKKRDLSSNQLDSSLTETYSKSYEEILDKYKTFVKDYYAKNEETINNEKEDPWSTMLSSVMYPAKPSNHGYAFRNLSENDVPELLLITKLEEENDYFINAIYSFIDNKPKLLETYWYRSCCYLGAENIIYVRGSNGAMNSVYLKFKINADGTAIETLQEIETDYDGKESKMRYYHTNQNSEKTEITEQEFQKIISQMPQDNKQSNLKFISLQ